MPPLAIQLSQKSGVPYYRQIVDQLAELVRAGQLGPGAQLPSVRELARDLLVSLITIRRAYADLEAEGLIVRRQGQGTFVSEGVAGRVAARVQDQARTGLGTAVGQALRAGLSPQDIRLLVRQSLEAHDA